MFETHSDGVVAHGVVDEVNVMEANQRLEDIQGFASVQCERNLVIEENWNAKWESDYQAVVVHGLQGEVVCTIRAPFHQPPRQGLDVVVTPQMSFGTGHHATTYLMIQALMSLNLDGLTLLDMGSGTGVLAITASMVGAKQVVGIDIEEAAVRNAKENMGLNGIQWRAESIIQFVHGDGECLDTMEEESWDVICANIHKNVLAADMSLYFKTLKQGGMLFLSGFFDSDVPWLQTHVLRYGMRVKDVTSKEGWSCMHCWKPSH